MMSQISNSAKMLSTSRLSLRWSGRVSQATLFVLFAILSIGLSIGLVGEILAQTLPPAQTGQRTLTPAISTAPSARGAMTSLEVTNGSGATIGVIRIAPDDMQIGLGFLAAGDLTVVEAAVGDRLGFSRDGEWLGGTYLVTEAPGQTVRPPVAVRAASAGASMGPTLRITNATSEEIVVMALVEGGGQAGLIRIAAGASADVPGSAGQTLGFVQKDVWLGAGYVVTGAAGEAVSVPVAAAAAPVAPLAPSAPLAPELQRQAGAGSVQLRLTNATGDAIELLVPDQTGAGSYVLATVPEGGATDMRALPDTVLYPVKSGTDERVGRSYKVTAARSQAVSLPVVSALERRNTGPGSAPVRITNTAVFPIEVGMVDPGAGADAAAEIFATVGAGQTVSARLLAPATLFVYDAAGAPVGGGYALAAGETQLSLPAPPSFPVTVRDPGGVAVTLVNGASSAIIVARVLPDGAGGVKSERLDVMQPGGTIQGPLVRGTALAFFDATTSAPVGDPYTVGTTPERVQIPYKAPPLPLDPVVAKQSGAGSAPLMIVNTSNTALYVSIEENGGTYFFAQLAPSATLPTRTLPKTRIWFYEFASKSAIGDKYETTGVANEEVRVPVPLTDPERSAFVGASAASVEIRNGSTSPAVVIARNATGLVSVLYEIPAGQTQVTKINPDTVVWFVKKSGATFNSRAENEPLGRKLPYLVAALTTPQRVELPYEPSDKEVERLARIDLDKLRDEVVAGMRKDGATARAQRELPNACWKDTQTRGVGTLPTTCKPGEDERGGLCYPSCKPGYKDFVTMCVPDCPAGFTNDGLYCSKPKPKERTAYPWKFGDRAFSLDDARARCRKRNGAECEKIGEIIYSTCPANYKTAPLLVNLCTPICPAGMEDIGVSCRKTTYDRGVGGLKQCSAGKERDAGLCYPSCRAGSSGVGPVCWDQCPKGLPVNCGTTCAASTNACVMAVSDQVNAPLMAVANIALTVVTAGAGTAATTSLRTALQAGKTAGLEVTKAMSKQAAREATEQAAKQTFKANVKTALATGGRRAATTGARVLAKELVMDTVISTAIGGAIYGLQQVPWRGIDAARDDIRAEVERRVRQRVLLAASDQQIDAITNAAFEAAKQAKPQDEFPWNALDPTGIADIVVAYNLPMCSSIK